MKMLLASLILASSLSSLAIAETKYYYGEVRFVAADGVTSQGSIQSLVKRDVDMENGSILETVIQPSQTTGKPETYVTHIDRIEGLNFKTYDEGKTFSGTIQFKSDSMSEWTYDISVHGGKLTGLGVLNKTGIETSKTFAKKSGEVVMGIREKLAEIKKSKYEKLKKQILK